MIITDKSAYFAKEPIHVTNPVGDLFISPVDIENNTMVWKPLANTAPRAPGFYAIGSNATGKIAIGTIIQVVDTPKETASKIGTCGLAAIAIGATLLGAGALYAYKKFKKKQMITRSQLKK